jgi:hypothetical protein
MSTFIAHTICFSDGDRGAPMTLCVTADEISGELGAHGNQTCLRPGLHRSLRPGSRLQASTYKWCKGIYTSSIHRLRCISVMMLVYLPLN